MAVMLETGVLCAQRDGWRYMETGDILDLLVSAALYRQQPLNEIAVDLYRHFHRRRACSAGALASVVVRSQRIFAAGRGVVIAAPYKTYNQA